MSEKPVLPIEQMTADEFNIVKVQYLDSHVLSDAAVRKIEELCCVGKPETSSVGCDVIHRHSSLCMYYNNPITGVVDRLLLEISRYKQQVADFEKREV